MIVQDNEAKKGKPKQEHPKAKKIKFLLFGLSLCFLK